MKKKKIQTKNINSLFDEKFGKIGTLKRDSLILNGILDSYNIELDQIPISDTETRLAKMQEMLVVLGDFRKEAGVTQKELATKTGMKNSYISRVEHGKSDIQLSSFLKILNALGVKFELTIA